MSSRTETLAAKALTIEDIAELNELFGFWVKQILYHATVEDEVMTAPLKNSQPARDNEAEHAVLAEKAGELANFISRGNATPLGETAREAAFTREEEQHKELKERSHEVEQVLKEVLGENKVTARTILATFARIIVCGTVALAETFGQPDNGPRFMRQILIARARIQGFLVLDYQNRFQEARTRLADWHRAGKLQYQYDIADGLENTPNAFLRVLTSKNLGKQLVRVGPET